jgi:zinc transport system substrate-binding protein
MMRRRAILIFTALLSFAAPCSLLAQNNSPAVYASNYSLQFFAQEIAGEALQVHLPEITGDPAYWVPDGDQAAALQSADLVILNGAGYESWLNFVTLRPDRLLDTTAGIKHRLLPLEAATVHQHGPEGEHSHTGTAFTTWLDPQLAIAQARAIAKALSDLAPEQSAGFQERLVSLEERLKQLDQELSLAFDQLQGQPIWFSHPVYQYLQNRYVINGRSVHWEPDEFPGTRSWIVFQNHLRDHPGRLMIWEGKPMGKTQDQLAELGIKSIVFDPLGNRPGQGDYFEVMSSNRQRLLEVMKDK